MDSKSESFRALVCALAVSVCAVWPALAEDKPKFRTELGVQGGLFLPDQDLVDKGDTLRELEAIGGIRFGFLFARNFGLSLDTTKSDINTVVAGDVDSQAARLTIDFFSRPYWKKLQWFGAVGGGVIDFDLDIGEDFNRPFASLSVGQRVALDHRARFRWELRVDQAFDEDDDPLAGEDLTRINALVALTWGLGRAPKDSDGDGVLNKDDKCPDTPLGVLVDKDGCPLDGDRDGVWDGLDKCPETPDGALVDRDGCALDGDRDGVPDGLDHCPDTPYGAVVDDKGCALDGDRDGVPDGIDECPNTPNGALVDDRGCALDSDGDGVPDGLDKCPGTPHGTPVDADGCPIVAPLFQPDEDRRTLILEGVFFQFDSDVLTSASAGTLDRVAESLKAWPEIRVEVGGHTDWIGTDAYNLDLSERRAASVRNHLVRKGVSTDQVTSRGYGESEPIAANQSEAGRANNRRVELKKLD